MIAAAVNKEFGVLATDSEAYDSAQDRQVYESLRLFYSKNFLITYMGKAQYFAKLDKSKLETDVPSLVLYMKDYLKKIKEEIEEADKPFCLFVMGMHKKLPTLIQFNSYLNFEPKYLFSDDQTKFATIQWGKEDTKEMTAYFSSRLAKQELVSPGIVGEILAKGIYKKGKGRGAVNTAWMKNDGAIFPLTGLLLA